MHLKCCQFNHKFFISTQVILRLLFLFFHHLYSLIICFPFIFRFRVKDIIYDIILKFCIFIYILVVLSIYPYLYYSPHFFYSSQIFFVLLRVNIKESLLLYNGSGPWEGLIIIYSLPILQFYNFPLFISFFNV